jgi:prepilin-type processing-associated H-X9-DG protein
MEQTTLHQQIDYSVLAFTGPFNAKVPNPRFIDLFATPIAIYLCPSDPAPTTSQVTVSGSTYTYGGVNYLISYGSGTATHYDLRWRTDGIVYAGSAVRYRDILDGSAYTVAVSESIRSVGPDLTLPSGQTPKFPYQQTANGSSGVSSALQPTPGMTASGAWSTVPPMVHNPNLAAIVPTITGWRGGASPALRGRGISWAFSGAINSLTNGYNSPNSRIPDVVVHFSGFFGPRAFHGSGANIGLADGSVQFISNSMETSIVQAIHSCNGSETVAPFN